MSKIVIRKTLKGISVVQEGKTELPFTFPESTASAGVLFAIFEELQVDGVAVIERGTTVGKLSYEIEIKTTLDGKPFPADPLEHQDAVAADIAASVTDRAAAVLAGDYVQSGDYVEGVSGWRISLTDLAEDPPFVVIDGQTYIKSSIIIDPAKFTVKTNDEEDVFASGDAEKILAYLRSTISATDLAQGVDAQIGEALAPQQVTNICSQNNNYGSDGLTKKQVRKLVRKEFRKCQAK